MDAFKIHADGLQDLLNEAGGDAPALWWNGGAIPILPGGATFKKLNSQGGLTISADLHLTVLASNFPPNFNFDSLPKQPFNYPGQGGTAYVIESIIKSPNLRQIVIVANAASENV